MKMRTLAVPLSLSLAASVAGSLPISASETSDATARTRDHAQGLANQGLGKMIGAIDNRYQIQMSLTRSGSDIEGSYSYTAVGKPLTLRGTIDASGNVQMTESDDKGDVTGTFNGHLVGGKRLVGQWTSGKAGEAPLPFIVCTESDANALDDGCDGVIIVQVTKKAAKAKRPYFPDTEAVVRYPQLVTTGLANKLVAAKLKSAVSLQNSGWPGPDELLRAVKQGDTWLDEFSYSVTYNRNYLLSFDFEESGSAAYPSFFDFHNVINTRTGRHVRAVDAFTPEGVRQLKRQLQLRMDAEATQAMKQADGTGESIKDLLVGEGTITDKLLDTFSLSEKGVTFHHDWHFPHVVLAMEPAGEYFFSYPSLKPYIRSDGPLAVFVKDTNKQEMKLEGSK